MSVCFLLGGGAVYVCRISIRSCKLSHARLQYDKSPTLDSVAVNRH